MRLLLTVAVTVVVAACSSPKQAEQPPHRVTSVLIVCDGIPSRTETPYTIIMSGRTCLQDPSHQMRLTVVTHEGNTYTVLTDYDPSIEAGDVWPLAE